MTLASALCWSTGIVIVFFKSGPFGYSGALAMWLPLAEFFVWLVVMSYLALKAISRQEALCRQEGLDKGEGFGVYPAHKGLAAIAPEPDAFVTAPVKRVGDGEMAGRGVR
jgi:hypothetical protein